MFPQLYGVLSQANGVTTILEDTFTDTDTTALSSHTPDIDTAGGAYANVAGSPTIQSNKAQSNGSGDLFSKNIGIDGSYSLSVEFTPQTSLVTHRGVCLRIAGSTSYVVIGHGNGGSTFIIGYRTGGGLTVVTSTAVSFSLGTTYTIAFTIDAASGITATLDGANQISGTAAVLTGNNNVGGLFSTNSTFDNLLVTA